MLDRDKTKLIWLDEKAGRTGGRMTEILTELKDYQDSVVKDPKLEQAKIDLLRKELGEFAPALNELQEKKIEIELSLKDVNKSMKEIETKIRNAWLPFIKADKAEINLAGGFVLKADKTLNIKADDNDMVTTWLKDNGFEGAMKWQIHNQTMKKIAKEEYENGVKIPGLVYSEFVKVKLK